MLPRRGPMTGSAPGGDRIQRIEGSGRSGFAPRLLGFAGVILLSGLASFAILPVISRVGGAAQWADFSAAQAIGTFGSVITLFGWGIYGPPTVARTGPVAERERLYRASIRVRAIVFALAAAAAAVISALVVSPANALVGILMAIATSAAGLSPAWYCIGVGRPLAIGLYDTAPRLAAALVATPILLLTGWVWVYPALLLIASLAGVAAFSRTLRADVAAEREGRWLSAARLTAPSAGIDAAANAYGAAPLPIATVATTPTDAAAFASADRAYRIGLAIAVVSLGNAFQAWVLDANAHDPRRRQLIAISSHAAIGLLGAAILGFAGPWLTALVFGISVAADGAIAWLYGIAFFFISTATPLIRNLLIPAGRSATVMTHTVITAALGLIIMSAGAVMHSVLVIGIAVAISEALLCLLLLVPALRVMPARFTTGAAT